MRHDQSTPLTLGAVLLVMLTAHGATIAGAASKVEVVARYDVFDSASAQVDTGGSVTWTNHGHSPHNVVADDGSFSSPTIKPGQGWEGSAPPPLGEDRA